MDTGANHLANVYHHMRDLVDELHLEWEPMKFLNYRIIKDGMPVGLLDTMGRLDNIRLAFQAFIGKRRKTDFFNLSTAVKYDTDNVEHFTRKYMGSRAFKYLIDPFVSVYQFHRGGDLSLGTMYAMIESQYNHTEDWKLSQIKGGMIALPQALADTLDTRLNTPVTNVAVHEQNSLTVATKDGVETVDIVVSAATADVTKKIYPKASPGQRAVLDGTEYASTLAVALKVPKDLLGDTTIVWVPYVEGSAISGYTNEAMKGDDLIHNGKTLLLVWFHETFAKTMMDKTDEEIYEIAQKELIKVCPAITDKSLLENHDIQRWPQAMPKFSAGHLSRVEVFLKKHQGENNVFFCGDYLNAPWTEGALQQGQRVAKEIIAKIEG